MKKKMIAGLLGLSMLAGMPYAAMAESPAKTWTNVNVYETQEEDGSLFNRENYDFVKYSQIPTVLQEIAAQSNRVTVEVTGKSADGRDLYVVTISDPSEKGKFGYQKGLRKQMFKNPEKAQNFVDKHPDFKTPILINASIHGTEFVGTDAALKLIERFATQNDETTKSILQNNILVFNVDANPDGRVNATRFNGAGIDLNRDFITQSQPETKQTVELIKEWNPMVLLDLHGYVKNYLPKKQGLIEPCTPPHNPNYEYDLYGKWATNQAEAMEASIVAGKANYQGQIYKDMVGTYIPQRDDAYGWDDYPPIFTPMYAMYHGAYGYTLEAPTNDWDGVQWHYDAVMGALTYATANKSAMVKDQIEIYKRGINFDHPNHEEGHFPHAYVLPVNAQDPTVTEKAVKHLIANDVQVEKAQKAFTFEGQTYPAGTYIVPMDQAKAGLANTMLWDGEDITLDTPAMYDISAWSLPELWGFDALPATQPLDVKTQKVTSISEQGALVGKGPYKIPNSSVQAVNLVNDLLKKGVAVQRDAAGDFYVKAEAGNVLKDAVKASGLSLQTSAVPTQSQALKSLKVAVIKDGGMWKVQSHSGTKLALDRLGFQTTEVTPLQVATAGLGGYDALVYAATEELLFPSTYAANKEFVLQEAAQLEAYNANVQNFVNNGGRYLGIGVGGAIAAQTSGITSVNVSTGDYSSNGIVKVDYSPSAVTAGYKANDLGFVYYPAWFTNTANADVLATYANSADFFTAGHWADRTGAQGQPVIVKEKGKNVTLIGLEAGFRDHTDYLFRLLSNSLYQ